jgi:acetylglutamate kinase
MVVARKVQSKAPKAIEDDGEPLVVDLGFVGEPDRIDTTVIDTICAAGMIPVIAPIGVGEDGATYNINADTMAGASPRRWAHRACSC